MKAHQTDPKDKPIVFKNYAELQKAVADEIAKQEPEIFKRHAEQLIPQAYATVFKVLDMDHGWKAKRLWQLIYELKNLNNLMEHPSPLLPSFSPIDCEREMKEKYGIDFRKEFPIRVEIQK